MTREHLDLIALTLEQFELYPYDFDSDCVSLEDFEVERMIKYHRDFLDAYEVELEKDSEEKVLYDRIKPLIGQIEFDLVLVLLEDNDINYNFNGAIHEIQSLEWWLKYDGYEVGHKITNEFGRDFDYDDLKSQINNYKL